MMNELAEIVDVICGKAKLVPEDEALVTPYRVRRVQAVIRKLADIDRCICVVRQTQGGV